MSFKINLGEDYILKLLLLFALKTTVIPSVLQKCWNIRNSEEDKD
jgi:hypothetical protein